MNLLDDSKDTLKWFDVLEQVSQIGLKNFISNFPLSQKNNDIYQKLLTINTVCKIITSNVEVEFIMLVGSILLDKSTSNDIDLFVIIKKKNNFIKTQLMEIINSAKLPNPFNKPFDLIIFSEQELFQNLFNNDIKTLNTFLSGKFMVKSEYWMKTYMLLKDTYIFTDKNTQHAFMLKNMAYKMLETFEIQTKHLYFYNLYEAVISSLQSFLLLKGYNTRDILESLEMLSRTKINETLYYELYKLFNEFQKFKNVNLNFKMTNKDIEILSRGYIIAKQIFIIIDKIEKEENIQWFSTKKDNLL